MPTEHIIVHITSIASVSADAMNAKILRCIKTLEMLELISLRLLYYTILCRIKSGYEEKEMDLMKEVERNSS
jgi:hypothetical protein